MLKIHVPEYKELRFRQEMMADEDTMSYNRAWGGTIPFPARARRFGCSSGRRRLAWAHILRI